MMSDNYTDRPSVQAMLHRVHLSWLQLILHYPAIAPVGDCHAQPIRGNRGWAVKPVDSRPRQVNCPKLSDKLPLRQAEQQDPVASCVANHQHVPRDREVKLVAEFL